MYDSNQLCSLSSYSSVLSFNDNKAGYNRNVHVGPALKSCFGPIPKSVYSVFIFTLTSYVVQKPNPCEENIKYRRIPLTKGQSREKHFNVKLSSCYTIHLTISLYPVLSLQWRHTLFKNCEEISNTGEFSSQRANHEGSFSISNRYHVILYSWGCKITPLRTV